MRVASILQSDGSCDVQDGTGEGAGGGKQRIYGETKWENSSENVDKRMADTGRLYIY